MLDKLKGTIITLLGGEQVQKDEDKRPTLRQARTALKNVNKLNKVQEVHVKSAELRNHGSTCTQKEYAYQRACAYGVLDKFNEREMEIGLFENWAHDSLQDYKAACDKYDAEVAAKLEAEERAQKAAEAALKDDTLD